jgi:hypothetical protein
MPVKYMLLIYNRPGFIASLSAQDRAELLAEVDALMAELTESGEPLGGQALADASTAQTIRAGGGQVAITDGPFMESKEQFGGYVTVDCETIERAIEIARRWPDVRFGGAMEVRAIMDEAGTEM